MFEGGGIEGVIVGALCAFGTCPIIANFFAISSRFAMAAPRSVWPGRAIGIGNVGAGSDVIWPGLFSAKLLPIGFAASGGNAAFCGVFWFTLGL
jgi:hypothetical protein